MPAVRGHLLEDGVGVQIHTADVGRGHVKVKVSGVYTHNERARCTEHTGQGQRAQGDVGAGPVEGEDHLKGRRHFLFSPFFIYIFIADLKILFVRTVVEQPCYSRVLFDWCCCSAHYLICFNSHTEDHYCKENWKGKNKRLTDTRASVTLVSTAGRREWTRILCSVTASTSSVAAFFGPRFSSNVERLPPLQNTNTHTQ